jgi:hypothetical protein
MGFSLSARPAVIVHNRRPAPPLAPEMSLSKFLQWNSAQAEPDYDGH